MLHSNYLNIDEKYIMRNCVSKTKLCVITFAINEQCPNKPRKHTYNLL